MRPRVVVSGCLEFEACRYNGQRIPFDLLGELSRHVDLEPVCPEVEVGLGVPREPVRLVRDSGSPALVQPATGLDVTSRVTEFAEGFLSKRRDVDGFILKSRSPTCGTRGVKIYDRPDDASVHAHGPGLFAGAVREHLPHAAVEEEGRLRNYRIREHFLTRLFARSRLRSVGTSGAMRKLVAFQTAYKLVPWPTIRMRCASWAASWRIPSVGFSLPWSTRTARPSPGRSASRRATPPS